MIAPQFETPKDATPIEDLSGLLPAVIYTYADLCAAEAENILRGSLSHLKRRKNPRQAWFTEEYLRKVHRDMFDSVWEWAGKYRHTLLNLGVPPERIHEEVHKLCGDVQYWSSVVDQPMSILEQAVRIHHKLAWIHPFPNGNGRHARLMADIYLYSHRHPLPMWPSSDIAKASDVRARYLEAIRAADDGNFTPLMEYTDQYMFKKP